MLDLWDVAGIDRLWLNLGAEFDAMLEHDGSLFLVALDRGVTVGAVMGGFDGRRGWVYHLAVLPEYRRRGIGRLLMKELERRMHNRGVTKINLQVRAGNHDVIGFYEGLGLSDEHLVSMGKRL